MMPFRRWIGEIHHRALWQTLGVYLAGSWVVLQVIDIVVDSLDLPRWLPAGAILLILAGLPVVLITAYVQVGREATREEAFGRDGATGSPEKTTGDLEDLEVRAARRLFTWRNALGAGVLGFAAWGVVAAGWVLFEGRSGNMRFRGAVALDRGVVAVLPFRVTGTGNLGFLSEGMVDLLAAKLTGEGGLRAADPRSVMSIWSRLSGGRDDPLTRDLARRLAGSVGAGQVLTGDVVGTPSGFVLQAAVMDVENGTSQARASVEGSLDSLTASVDQLVLRLLALEAGEEGQRLGALTSTSLQALRAYLDGQAAYRRGSYREADGHFQRALEADSTFSLAALGWVASAWWSPGYDRFNRAREAAWNLREGLSSRDRALLEAWAGPRYPLASGWAEHLVRWDLAIAAAPERPESWYESADIYFHYGPLLEVSDWEDQAKGRLRRAAVLDPTFAAPLAHLLELAAIRGDPDEVRFHQRAYAAVDSAGDTSWFTQWRAASALGDTAALAGIHGEFSRLDGSSLSRIMGLAQLFDPTVTSAERAASTLSQRVGTRIERWEWLLGLHSLALNRGRPGEADALIREWAEVEGFPGESLRIRVLDGLYWDGDPASARGAADLLLSAVDTLSPGRTDLSEAQLADVCVAEHWRLGNGDTSTALSSLARFRDLADQTRFGSLPLRHAVCAASIEALLAMAQDRPEAEAAVQKLNNLLLLVPNVETGDDTSLVGPFIVARWRERSGDVEGALAAMRRWHNHWFSGVRYLSTFLREQGRLAALVGNREEAIRALRRYLTLRSDPEPEWVEERDRVRARLRELMEAETLDRPEALSSR